MFPANCFLRHTRLRRSRAFHAAQPDALNLSYSALVPSGAPFWIAHDLKLFEREGLKPQLLYINAAPRVMAAILAGEVEISLSGVSPLVLTYAQGSDPLAIAGAVNQINVSIFARPEIRSPEEFRGKRMGITRFGGLTDFSGSVRAKKWGLQPAKTSRSFKSVTPALNGRYGGQHGASRDIAAAVDDSARATSLSRASRSVQVRAGVSKYRGADHQVVAAKVAG